MAFFGKYIRPLLLVAAIFLTSCSAEPRSLADYIADPAERAELAGELFSHVAAGRIRIEINQSYELADAVRAHRDLEAGISVGSSVLRP